MENMALTSIKNELEYKDTLIADLKLQVENLERVNSMLTKRIGFLENTIQELEEENDRLDTMFYSRH